MRDRALLCSAILGLALCCSPVFAQDRLPSTVGMPVRIDQLILPGSELEARPIDDKKPVVLRVVASFPHGTAFRYDLVYYGLEPGRFDLGDYLKRKDGSPAKDLPAIPVTIVPLLPPGQVQPNALELQPSPWLGGYRVLMIATGLVWMVGFVLILLVGRRKKASLASAGQRPATLADRLRPLVEKAGKGELSRQERAELERLLLVYWRRRLDLGDRKPAEAFTYLRRHAEAGPLLEQLEAWLHRPQASGDVDLTALLRPYQKLPADALDEISAGARRAS